ncbi:protein of unknown function [Candidatus Nitrosocosmicus franklandus]|uniref:Uncharacterized protein n=1 Tax=Candidatus Nitrosocosmicus franklandianus TaxID=1798806 RepID=A0A484IBV3_9ARCH|nr:protein of unknown function [Candidatus Nitrosocosmicus franklandus]
MDEKSGGLWYSGNISHNRMILFDIGNITQLAYITLSNIILFVRNVFKK